MKDKNKMEIGLNSQLKVIYRPFKEPANIQRIADAMTFSLADNGPSLILENDSPYYVTPVEIKFSSPSG